MRKGIGVSNTVAAVGMAVLLIVGFVGGFLFSGSMGAGAATVVRTEYVTVGGTVTQRITITTTAAAGQVSGPPLKIGMTISKDGLFAPLTSGYESFNREWLNWVNNVRKGVYIRELGARVPVEIIMYDDRSQPDLAIQLYTKLATEDRVHILVSPYSADIGIQLIPTVAERYRVPMIM
ncbi:MAG: ABC transporter substrate-binding protein, partial [Candidatus Caldarchaeum sp.]|nr:ABC transporter substrate-binding protein [Candidatus Caldarchaeum sp.]MDW7978440.1 ABC transporter substrate-binding protein [Candidatus Caldarchaeum sp.]